MRRAVAKDDIRNGRIERKLSFPLEDLYGDGQPAGQVGQEIYGCGGTFVFTARGFHQVQDAPFIIFTDYPCDITRANAGGLTVRLRGPSGFKGRVRLARRTRRKIPRIVVRDGDTTVSASRRDTASRDYRTAADATLSISWT